MVLQALRYGMPLAIRNPGFTAVVVLTLGLGIGANTAMFSVVNAVLLRPIPWENPDRLVLLREGNRKQGGDFISPSTANYCGWRGKKQIFPAKGHFPVVFFHFFWKREGPRPRQGISGTAGVFSPRVASTPLA